MNPVLVNAPATEPVDTADAQTHLRVSGEATYIASLVKAARGQVERYLNRALINQTWDVYYNNWSEVIRLPYPPVSSVSYVKYYDTAGNLQTLSSSLYHLVTQSEPACIVRKYSATYPDLEYGRPAAIVVRQVCGYGTAASSVPEPIKHAIKLLVTDYYEHRGTNVIDVRGVAKIPAYITDLIHSYKIYDF